MTPSQGLLAEAYSFPNATGAGPEIARVGRMSWRAMATGSLAAIPVFENPIAQVPWRW